MSKLKKINWWISLGFLVVLVSSFLIPYIFPLDLLPYLLGVLPFIWILSIIDLIKPPRSKLVILVMILAVVFYLVHDTLFHCGLSWGKLFEEGKICI